MTPKDSRSPRPPSLEPARQPGTYDVQVGSVETAGGRTYTAATSNPKQFILPPGRYVVTVGPVRPAGLGKKDVEVEVAEGKITEQTVTF